MENVRNIWSLMSLLLIISCAPGVFPVNALQSNTDEKPEWISRKTGSKVNYIGVGFSKKSNNENYLQTAKSIALDDLVSEIEVQISSVSVLNQLDDGESFSEEYESVIKTEISNEIEGYEFVDSWEDENEYWVCYRLSKVNYKSRKAKKREDAISLAKDNYLKGKEHIAMGDVASAITSYINGFCSLAPYVGQAEKILFEGDTIILESQLYNEIQNVFNDLELSSSQNEYTISRRLDQDEAIDVIVKTKSHEEVGQLPLIANFSKGNGHVHPEYITDDHGISTIFITSIKSTDARQTITVSPDLEKLINLDDSMRKYIFLLRGLQLPKKELHFQIIKPIVFIESKEDHLGESTNSKLISNKLKEILTEKGFALSRNKDESELSIELSADTEKGKSSGSIYVTYFNLIINVIDSKSGTEIHHSGIDRLKAFSLNYDRSSQSGYKKALEVLEKETFPQLIEEILR